MLHVSHQEMRSGRELFVFVVVVVQSEVLLAASVLHSKVWQQRVNWVPVPSPKLNANQILIGFVFSSADKHNEAV